MSLVLRVGAVLSPDARGPVWTGWMQSFRTEKCWIVYDFQIFFIFFSSWWELLTTCPQNSARV